MVLYVKLDRQIYNKVKSGRLDQTLREIRILENLEESWLNTHGRNN